MNLVLIVESPLFYGSGQEVGVVYFNMDMVYLVWEYGSDRHIHRKLATFQGNTRKRVRWIWNIMS